MLPTRSTAGLSSHPHILQHHHSTCSHFPLEESPQKTRSNISRMLWACSMCIQATMMWIFISCRAPHFVFFSSPTTFHYESTRKYFTRLFAFAASLHCRIFYFPSLFSFGLTIATSLLFGFGLSMSTFWVFIVADTNKKSLRHVRKGHQVRHAIWHIESIFQLCKMNSLRPEKIVKKSFSRHCLGCFAYHPTTTMC